MYLWNILSTTTENGVHTVDVYWSNGTEAGYRSVEILVYYPTELTTSRSEIVGHTNDSITIRVFFNETFTPRPLNSSLSNVTCSLNGGSNVSMTDVGNGTLYASGSTADLPSGQQTITVFGAGFAIQNWSIVISVSLTHATLPPVLK